MKQSEAAANEQPKHVEFESNPFKVIIKGWEWLFASNRRLAIGLVILGILSSFWQVADSLRSASQVQTTPAPAGDPANAEPSRILFWVFTGAFVAFIALVFTVIINGTLNYISWKTSRQEKTTLGEALKVIFDKFWTLTAVYLLSFLRILGGLFLLIIPGIRAVLRYQLVLFPVFEEDLKGRAALNRIKELTDKHLMEVLGMSVAANIVPFLSLPLQTGGEAVLYRQLKDLKDSGAAAPKTHWLNYLGLVLMAAMLVFLAGVILFFISFR